MKTPFGQFSDICRMIKIEHSVFALPYAYAGSVLAARGMPPLDALLFLTIAMIAVRSFAMAFNRLVDLPFDRANPRTQDRPLVTGRIGTMQTWVFCAVMAAVFILACWGINHLCLLLSLPALLFAGIYSFLKRYTSLCHFWLGATLGLAPLAGWLAVEPNFLGMPAILLFFAVTFWVGAFDIYFSFQDQDFDREWHLHSIPACMGQQTAMAIAGFSHAVTVIFLFLAGLAAQLAWPWHCLCAGIAILLFVEHRLVKPDDLRNINTAFFTINGIISPLVLLGTILGIAF